MLRAIPEPELRADLADEACLFEERHHAQPLDNRRLYGSSDSPI